jgi:hypothetical protein
MIAGRECAGLNDLYLVATQVQHVQVHQMIERQRLYQTNVVVRQRQLSQLW